MSVDKKIDEKAAARALVVLNEALALDPDAVNELLAARPNCTTALAAHPTIQCCRPAFGEAYNTVSMLGLINGLLGVDDHGWGPIAAVYDCDSGKILRFESATGLATATKGATSPA